ncbi:Ltp family lipoprotein [Gordonia westfalica]|uniref:Host cell surface-exposed lipoprotein n=1 Tax=Gordonia westfalica TaxID=158898 RepID=A0A1H2JE69_9ACTN|nr:Ltp family lipoprotein [Gordonia westfalica]MDS1112424.1 Ltp family lipoprotein [Gordonia westfalica]SDU54673.1 Host cell surface-exposed lipoprotein [Gordonia westfalica]
MINTQKKRSWAAGVLAVFVMMIGVAAGFGTSTSPQAARGVPAPVIKLVSEKSNAVAMAREYLAYSSFSKSGLIGQLEFEGFSYSDSSAAVDQLEADREVNWYVQAAKSARQYREYSPFSRQGLIEQLEFEGFTSQQAVYGADHS